MDNKLRALVRLDPNTNIWINVTTVRSSWKLLLQFLLRSGHLHVCVIEIPKKTAQLRKIESERNKNIERKA